MEPSQLRTARHSSVHRIKRGTDQVKNRSDFRKLVPDSVSRSSDTSYKDSFNSEFSCIHSKQVVGAPIKKLLAEEMSREAELKRRSPNVIARLMGLDVLPQLSSHKQQKRSSEISVQRVAPMETARRNSSSHSCRSSRKSSRDEQEFKDVFEVLDATRMECSGQFIHGMANSKLTAAEMAFIQQKFMNAKRLSTDEKLQNSKEFRDTLEDLDSNKDLLLKFLEQPDSLFTQHAHDLQLPLPQYHCGHTCAPATKSSHSSPCGSNGLGFKIDRAVPSKNQKRHHDGPYGHSTAKNIAHNPLKSSNLQVEGKIDSVVLPTKIVVLKPNLGKVQNATRGFSSSSPSHDFLLDCGNHPGLCIPESCEAEVRGKKRNLGDAGPSRCKSRESKIAKEITKQMRNTLRSGSMNFSTSGFRGYAGDESSSSRSETESVNELEGATVTAKHPTNWSNRYRPSSSRSNESSVSREARKRLSERWRMTHNSVDMGVVSRGSTLADMLATPDREVRRENSDALISSKTFTDNFDGSDGPAGWVEPLGISSRDGWKDGCIRNLSRSRSLPASSNVISSPKTGMRLENLRNDRCMVPKEVVQRGRNKAVKGTCSQRDGLSHRTSRSRARKPIAPRNAYSDCSSGTSPEIHFGHSEVQSMLRENNATEKNQPTMETSVSEVRDASLVPESVVDVEVEHLSTPFQAINHEFSLCMSVKGDSSGDLQLSSQEQQTVLHGEDSRCMQQSVAEIGSPASSKRADQPSPVSVLEAPFPDDLSSGSECFESLSADIHGLRKQIQLLRSESEAYKEGLMLISSDEEVDSGFIRLSEQRGKMEESKEFSYIVDVLLGSGIDDADLDTFMAARHSPECPVNPQVFEELEKRSCNQSSLRSERRLLFDRINLSLVVIYQKFVPPHPWVRPASKLAHPKWTRNRLEDSLQKLLSSEDKRAGLESTAEKVLVNESQWLDLGEEIDVIGREIEKLLTDELVKELVTM